MSDSASVTLWNRQFILLNAAICLAFANLAVFFQFYGYLRTLTIDPRWFGLIIGAFSATTLILRPLISPLLRPDNSRRWVLIAATFVILSLLSYNFTDTFKGLMAVRVFHGAAHVVMATALLALVVGFIPRRKSGQAFGAISISTLLPYALVPPLLLGLTRMMGSYPRVLAFFGLIMLFMVPLILSSGSRKRADEAVPRREKISGGDVWANLKDTRVCFLLLAMLLFFSGYALVFFYLAGYGAKLGIIDAGLFFTLSTVGEIGVRLLAGSLFDKTNKAYLLAGALLFVALGYLALAHVPGRFAFFALGALLGLGWGVAMPALNALLFDISEERFRALNTNLGMEMFQGGFFIGPFIGGLILASHEFSSLFYLCAILSAAAAGAALYAATRS
ncbi:MAG: MFS transporter [Deltaproteobacteria bacterium]|nr:MFS transporter [Deltaproteobacteria bacterium]